MPTFYRADLERMLMAFQTWQITSGPLKSAIALGELRKIAEELADKYDMHLPDFEDEVMPR